MSSLEFHDIPHLSSHLGPQYPIQPWFKKMGHTLLQYNTKGQIRGPPSSNMMQTIPELIISSHQLQILSQNYNVKPPLLCDVSTYKTWHANQDMSLCQLNWLTQKLQHLLGEICHLPYNKIVIRTKQDGQVKESLSCPSPAHAI